MADLPHRVVPDTQSTLNFEHLRETKANKYVFDVTDYGAVPTDSSDDTVAVQQAVNAAIRAGRGTIYFPPGTYWINSIDLTGANNLIFEGKNLANLYHTLSADLDPSVNSGKPLPMFYKDQFTRVLGKNLVWQGLNFYGESVATHPNEYPNDTVWLGSAITLMYVENVTVQHCYFQDFVDQAVGIRDGWNTEILYNRVEHCAYMASGRNALNVVADAYTSADPPASEDVTGFTRIHGNYVSKGATAGIIHVSYRLDKLRVIITGNQVEDYGWVGIACEGGGPATTDGYAQEFVIADNIVLNCDNGIVSIATGAYQIGTRFKNGVIANNYIDNSFERGGDSTGIRLNHSNFVVTGNVVRAASTCLVWLATSGYTCTNTLCTDNIFSVENDGNSDVGNAVFLSTHNQFVFSDNIIVDTDVESAGGLYINGTYSDGVISGNLIYNASTYGIRFANDPSDLLVTNNRIIDCNGSNTTGYGIAANGTTATNLIIRDNYITDSNTQMQYGVGITATTCSGVLVENNVITGAATAAVGTAAKIDLQRGNDNLTSSSVASAATIALNPGREFFTITGTTNITSITATHAGHVVTLKFAGALTFTDGSNLKLNANANFVTTADDTISLVCDGTNWLEIARSVN